MSHPAAFWSIAVFLSLWGLAYAGLVVFTFFIATPEHWQGLVADGRIKAEYASYISRIPGWVIAITIIAAATRLLGGLALLMHKDGAVVLYAISLALVTVIMFRGFVLAGVADVIRPSQVVLEFGFFVLSVFALWFAVAMSRQGILH